MSVHGNGCLHREAKPLVTAEFFPASIALLFFVLLFVSLLKKVRKNIGNYKTKYPENLLITFNISNLTIVKKTPVKRWIPPGVLKK